MPGYNKGKSESSSWLLYSTCKEGLSSNIQQLGEDRLEHI